MNERVVKYGQVGVRNVRKGMMLFIQISHPERASFKDTCWEIKLEYVRDSFVFYECKNQAEHTLQH